MPLNFPHDLPEGDPLRKAMEEKDRLDMISLEQDFTTCPLERMIGQALDEGGHLWKHESHPDRRQERTHGRVLDFYLPYYNIYIEAKMMYTDRVSAQLASQPNVILIQGLAAAEAFCDMIKGRRCDC